MEIIFGLDRLKRKLRFCKIEKQRCGLNIREYYGQIRGTKILNIFIVVPQRDLEKIQWKELETRVGYGELNKMR